MCVLLALLLHLSLHNAAVLTQPKLGNWNTDRIKNVHTWWRKDFLKLRGVSAAMNWVWESTTGDSSPFIPKCSVHPSKIWILKEIKEVKLGRMGLASVVGISYISACAFRHQQCTFQIARGGSGIWVHPLSAAHEPASGLVLLNRLGISGNS